MDQKEFQQEYLEFLKAYANKERAVKEKAYLYSDLKHYGVSMADRGRFFRECREKLLRLDKKEALHLVRFYWGQPSFEERSLALNILNLHKEELNIGDMPLIERLMRESRGWALLDSLIIPLMSVIIAKDSKGYQFLKKWIKDDDFWVRRSALLAQVLFFRANSGGDKELFFNLAKSQFDESWIEENYQEPEQRKRVRFFIRKAIGWTVREISAKDPESAFKFLKEYQNQMSGLSFRDGSRKLPAKWQEKLK